MRYPVGLRVYASADLSHGDPYELVAFIEDFVDGDEIWWAYSINKVCLAKISVGKRWKPAGVGADTDQKKDNAAKFAVDLDKVIRDLNAVNTLLWKALRGLGKEKQYRDELCWCQTVDGMYCVSQPQCTDAKKAIEALCKLQKGDPL